MISALVTLINLIFFLFFPWIFLMDEQGAFVLWKNTNDIIAKNVILSSSFYNTQ